MKKKVAATMKEVRVWRRMGVSWGATWGCFGRRL